MDSTQKSHAQEEQEGGCIAREMGKTLENFNAACLDGVSFRAFPKFQEMIDHLYHCKFCRKKLSFMGKAIFESEMFLGGYFVEGKAKEERKRQRTRWSKGKKFRGIDSVDEILKRFSEGEFRTELKKIKQFTED